MHQQTQHTCTFRRWKSRDSQDWVVENTVVWCHRWLCLWDHHLIQRPKGVKRMRKSWAGKEQKMGKMRLQNSSRKSLTTINTRAEKKTCSHRHWRGEHIATETWELRRQWRDYGSESTSFLKHRWSCAQSQTLDTRQHKTEIPQRKEMNKMGSRTVQTMEEEFR